MKYSNLFTKTLKDIPHDADSANAEFLTRGGYIHQEVAGVYTFCPLGLKVLSINCATQNKGSKFRNLC